LRFTISTPARNPIQTSSESNTNGSFNSNKADLFGEPLRGSARRPSRTRDMAFTITTWNINSVRLRLNLVARFIRAMQPDVICLQETKCPDDAFPLKRFKRLGYEHIALSGQKGYHGVAIISRLPFDDVRIENFCGKTAALREPLSVHNFYVPAGGDEPNPEINEKFAHKLAFLTEMRARDEFRPAPNQRSILVGDLNVAPLEHDVWSHKQMMRVVSHTPIECEKLIAVQKSGRWVDALRAFTPEPTKLYTWWSYRSPDWAAADKGRRLDHIWVSDALGDRLRRITITREARGWPRPSDHVPVTAAIEL
jgi:exodeoxyribonuclease-3